MNNENSLTKYDNRFEEMLCSKSASTGGTDYLLTKNVSASGIARPYLYDYLARHPEIQKLDRGIYYRGSNPDNYYVLAFHKKVIFSHASAAYLHGLISGPPKLPAVCLPMGYNKARMKGDPETAAYVDGTNILIHLVPSSEFYDGVEELTTRQGHVVKSYCVEKALCQLLKNPGGCSEVQYYDAVRSYFHRDSLDHHLLRAYARKYRVEEKVFEYYNLLR